MSLFVHQDTINLLRPQSINYHVDIKNKFALCRLQQIYKPCINIDQAEYHFVVDYNSAFCDLTIRTPWEKFKELFKKKMRPSKHI